MNYVRIDYNDIINGPGVRAVLWVQGCEHHCTECHNKTTWNRNGGQPYTSIQTEELVNYLSQDFVDGITISGGDPLMSYNVDEVLSIAETLKQRTGKSIWIYTGYTWEALLVRLTPQLQEKLFKFVDVVVDGRFIKELKVVDQYRGSSNQRIISVSDSKDKVVLWHSKFGGQ